MWRVSSREYCYMEGEQLGNIAMWRVSSKEYCYVEGEQ